MPAKRTITLTLSIALLLVLITLVLLPYGLKLAIQKGLEKQGAQHVAIQDIDFNPFKGVLIIHDLKVYRDAAVELSAQYAFADLDWLPLLHHHLHIRDISLQSARVHLSLTPEGQWLLAGLATPVAGGATSRSTARSESTTPWTAQIDTIKFQDARIVLALPAWQGDLDIKQLNLTQLNSGAPDQTARLDLQGDVNTTAVHVQGELRPFASHPAFQVHTRFQSFDLGQLHGFVPMDWQHYQGKLTTDSQWTIHQDKDANWHIGLKGTLALQDIQLDHPDIQLHSGSLDWQGETDLTLPVTGAPGLILNGTLDNTDTRLALPAANLDLALGKYTFDGRVTLPDVTDTDRLQVEGKLHDQDIEIAQREPALTWLHAAALTVDQIKFDGLNQLSLDNVVLQQPKALQAGADATPVFHSGQLRLAQAGLTDLSQLTISQVETDKANINLTRTKAGDWLGLPATGQQAAAPAKQTTDAVNEAAAKPFRFRVDQIDLAKNSALNFTDNSVTPAVTKHLIISQFRIGPLDSIQPQQRTRVAIKARDNDYATLSVQGWLQAFADRLSSDIKVQLDQLDLPPLSPYLTKLTGYAIQSGMLHDTSSIAIKGDQLDIVNKLKLNQLQLQAVDADTAAEFNKTLSMPLDAALSTLRDKDDNIDLTLPIKGSLRDPDFDLSHIINKALGNALKSATMGYLKFALQPYGALITLGEFIGEQASSIRLAPVEFPPGQAVPTEAGKPYLAKLGELLHQRPALQIKLCGFATAADRAALQDQQAQQQAQAKQDGKTVAPVPITDAQLLELARQRSAQLKADLVKQFQVQSERLFTCKPAIDNQTDAVPRVALGL